MPGRRSTADRLPTADLPTASRRSPAKISYPRAFFRWDDCVIRSLQGVRVDRSFTGERSGAPARERFPTFFDRGHPGGTIGTTTGRRKAKARHLLPGEMPAGGRKQNRRGGRSVSAPYQTRSNRTAFAGRPPPPWPKGQEGAHRTLKTRGEPLAGTGKLSRSQSPAGRNHRRQRCRHQPQPGRPRGPFRPDREELPAGRDRRQAA